MKTYLIVTITCPDRPGIVERITQRAVTHAANWEDSRLARLGGDFAGIVKLTVDSAHAERLTQALLALADQETTILVKATHEDLAQPPTGHTLLQLQLFGADHEGIVHKVAAYLAGHGINVETMDTSISRAPMSAAPLFQMNAVIRVPAGLSAEELGNSLRLIGNEMGVDIDLQPYAE